MKYLGKSDQGVHPSRVHALIFLLVPHIAPGGLYTSTFVICSRFGGYVYSRGAIYEGAIHEILQYLKPFMFPSILITKIVATSEIVEGVSVFRTVPTSVRYMYFKKAVIQ